MRPVYFVNYATGLYPSFLPRVRGRMKEGGLRVRSVLCPPKVQSTLLRLGIFPPPSPGATVFRGLDRPGARCAADARIALIVQPIVRQIISPHIVPNLTLGPIGQRIDLDDIAVIVIDLDFLHLGARDCLLAAQ